MYTNCRDCGVISLFISKLFNAVNTVVLFSLSLCLPYMVMCLSIFPYQRSHTTSCQRRIRQQWRSDGGEYLAVTKVLVVYSDDLLLFLVGTATHLK